MKHSDNAKYCVICFGQDVNMNCISCKLVLAALNVAACAVHHYRRKTQFHCHSKYIFIFNILLHDGKAANECLLLKIKSD